MQNYQLLGDEKKANSSGSGGGGSSSGSNGNPASGLLGEGTYGAVYMARHRETGQVVAIKKFKESDADEATKKTSLREVRLLKQLRHDNIVSLLEVFRRKGKLYLVFEFVDQTILELIERQYPTGLPPDEAKKYTYQLLRGIDYCHQHGVIHRDIKPENVLISKAGTLKICDFGFARVATTPGARLTDYVATRWYRAPELLVGDTQYNKYVDTWAIGCIFAEISTGMPLFPGESDLDQIAHISRCFGRLVPRHVQVFRKNELFRGVQMPEPADGRSLETLERRFPRMDAQWLQFLKCCLRLDPEQRLTCQQLMDLPYFTEGGWRDRYEAHLAQVFEAEQKKLMPIRRSTQQQADAQKAAQGGSVGSGSSGGGVGGGGAGETGTGSNKNTPPPTANGRTTGGGGAVTTNNNNTSSSVNNNSSGSGAGKARTPSPVTLAATQPQQQQQPQPTSKAEQAQQMMREQQRQVQQEEQARLTAMLGGGSNNNSHYQYQQPQSKPSQQQQQYGSGGIPASRQSMDFGVINNNSSGGTTTANNNSNTSVTMMAQGGGSSSNNSNTLYGASSSNLPPHHRSSGATSPASLGSSSAFGNTLDSNGNIHSHRQTPTNSSTTLHTSMLPDIRGGGNSVVVSGGGGASSLLPAIGRNSPSHSMLMSSHTKVGGSSNSSSNNTSGNNNYLVTSNLASRLPPPPSSSLTESGMPPAHHPGGYTFTSSLSSGVNNNTSSSSSVPTSKKVGVTTTTGGSSHATHYGIYGHSSAALSNNSNSSNAPARHLPSLGVTGSSATSIFASNSPLYVSGQTASNQLTNNTSSSGTGGGGGSNNNGSSNIIGSQLHHPSPYAMPVGGVGTTGLSSSSSTGQQQQQQQQHHGLGLTYKKKNPVGAGAGTTAKKGSNVSSLGLPSYLPPSGGGGGGGGGTGSGLGGVGGGGSLMMTAGPHSLYAAPQQQPSFGVTGVAAGRAAAVGVGGVSSGGGHFGGGGAPSSSEGKRRHN